MTTNKQPHTRYPLAFIDARAQITMLAIESLNLDTMRAYDIVEEALDVDADSYDDLVEATFAAFIATAFSGDDDYDDFRHELMSIIDPDDARETWGYAIGDDDTNED